MQNIFGKGVIIFPVKQEHYIILYTYQHTILYQFANQLTVSGATSTRHVADRSTTFVNLEQLRLPIY